MSLINVGAGLSAMGNSISSFAGQAGLAEQKSQLEQQQTQLASDLAMGRDQSNQAANLAAQVQRETFDQAQSDKTIQAQKDLETQREAHASSEGALQRKNALDIANIEPSDKVVGKPIPLSNGNLGVVMDGGTIKDTGQKALDTNTGAWSPTYLKLATEQLAAGDPSPLQHLGLGAIGQANGTALRNSLADYASQNNISGSQLAAMNAQYFGTKAAERAVGTRQAQVDMPAVEFQQMAPLALEASKAVDRSQYPNLNALELAVQKGSGDPNVIKLAVGINSLVNIYSRAINPNGVGTDSDKAHARELLDKAYTDGQINAGVDMMQQEIARARTAPGIVRQDLFNSVQPPAGKATPIPANMPPLGVPGTGGIAPVGNQPANSPSINDLLKKYSQPQ